MRASTIGSADGSNPSSVGSTPTPAATHTVALIRMDSMGKVTYGGEAFNLRVLVDKLIANDSHRTLR